MEAKLIFSRYEDKVIENLGFVRPFTNSEVQQLACNRSYTFEYVECLESENINTNFAYGSCWHSLLEDILEYSKENDKLPQLSSIKTKILSDYRTTIVEKYFEDQPTQAYDSSYIQELKESILDRLLCSIEGWYENWIENIQPNYKVIDVEKIIYSQVSLNNEKLEKEFILVEQELTNEYVYRHLYTGELDHYNKTGSLFELENNCISFKLINKTLPIYKVGKIDTVLLHRRNNDIWVLDHKTTKSVQSYISKTRFNLQLIGYCSLLRDMINDGLYNEYGNVHVGGIIWDISSNDISSSKVPKPLKSKKLSKSESKIIPYWLYKRAIIENNYKIEDYEDFIKYLKSNSNKFFDIKIDGIPNSELDRVKSEDFYLALRLYKTRAYIESIDFDNPYDWDLKSSRFTICNLFGSCKFSNKCFANTKPNVIFNLSRRQKIQWKKPKT